MCGLEVKDVSVTKIIKFYHFNGKSTFCWSQKNPQTLADVPTLLENYFHVTSKERSDWDKGDEDGAERPNQSQNGKQQRVNVGLQQNPEKDLERT